ncbi:MAG: long-chain fatty acid--CoA ligase [Haliangiales bacterium]
MVEGDVTLSYTWLAERSRALAHDLRGRGIAVGDRVLISLHNSRWSPVAYLGVWLAGGTPVAVNPALTVVELKYVVADATPRFYIVDSEVEDDGRNRIAEAMPADSTTWHYHTGDETSEHSLASLRGINTDDSPDRIHLSKTALILFTSGTTGHPKGVELEHDNLVWAMGAWNELVGVCDDDVVYAGLPLFHIYALVIIFVCSAAVGARIILAQGFPFPKFIDDLQRHKVTIFLSVPPVFEALATDRWGTAPAQFASLRLAVSAAAPLSQETYRKASRVLGDPAFYEGYGITETASIVSFGPLDAPHRVGSCGLPAPGVSIRIVDETGRECPQGVSGEIWIHSPGTMRGYRNNPEATAAVLTDGWYHSGDIGYLDADNYLFITDRLKDVLFVAGANVYPREVEEAIATCPGVDRTAVVRMKYPATGEAPCAFVVRTPGSNLSTVALLNHLKSHLAAYKLPKRVEFVDDIPTSPSGKVLRRELRLELERRQ